jgi:uncharacterized protein
MARTLTFLCLALAVTGCGNNSARYLINTPVAAQKVAVRVATIEVLDVKLPAYAAALEVPLQEEGGALRNLPDSLWADDPVRGVTNALARSLEATTTAKVAAEPWPLETSPQAVVDLRVDRMLASAAGQFEFAGQYAIASPDGVIRERLERFDIRIPLGTADPAGIVAAEGKAIAELGLQIARTLAR